MPFALMNKKILGLGLGLLRIVGPIYHHFRYNLFRSPAEPFHTVYPPYKTGSRSVSEMPLAIRSVPKPSQRLI